MVEAFPVSESCEFGERLSAVSGHGVVLPSAWFSFLSARVTAGDANLEPGAACFSCTLDSGRSLLPPQLPPVPRTLQAFEAGAVCCSLDCVPSGVLLFSSSSRPQHSVLGARATRIQLTPRFCDVTRDRCCLWKLLFDKALG